MTTQLRWVSLEGPLVPRPADVPEGKWKHLPFWTLSAGVPFFGLENVRPKKEAKQEDRIHPVRTLLLDPESVVRGGEPWRNTRLVSLHLIAGQQKDQFYYEKGDDKESLTVHLTGRPRTGPKPEVSHAYIHGGPFKPTWLVFRTFDPTDVNPGDDPKAKDIYRDRAGFQHVVAEPLLGGADAWPRNDEDEIEVPSFRLVSGAIELLVNTSPDAKDYNFKWLGAIQPKDYVDIDTRRFFRVRLTPDGIELATEVPFPTMNGTPRRLPGWFLLSHGVRGLRLQLLPERLTPELQAQWSEAWTDVTPADDSAEEAAVGFKVEARRGGLPPAFSWDVEVGQDEKFGPMIKELEPKVEVPGADVRVRLLSPLGPNGVDGEVTLRPEAYRLSQFGVAALPEPLREAVAATWVKPAEHPVLLSARIRPPAVLGEPVPPPPTTRLVLLSSGKELSVRLDRAGPATSVHHRCAHDGRALAAALRQAYGLPDLLPGQPDLGRPLLSAFAPLDDGWLQLPIPNLAPLNPDSDSDTLHAPVAAPGNILSGYLRFAQTGKAPAVLSAFSAEALTVTEAPWLITVEGAREAALAIGLGKNEDRVEPRRAAAALDGPELSTRGLVWFSADRPDALEALPRLGAGPGVYLDVPLESFDTESASALSFAIEGLEVRVEEYRDQDSKRHELSRPLLTLSLAFDRTAKDWTDLCLERGAVRTQVAEALASARPALAGAPAETPVKGAGPWPLPPVVWQRHPRMPLAATMPMTRAASSAVRPLESRDLVPFVVDLGKPTKDAPVALLRMTWATPELSVPVFPRLFKVDGTQLHLIAARGWPWPEGLAPVDRGISLAAFGVPGAELAFLRAGTSSAVPWTELSYSLRYDLPALDEAFASAALPPQPPDRSQSEERDAPRTEPVATALDWASMKRFWEDQDRRHQNARVAHSHLSAYLPIAQAPKAHAVPDLVGGALWTCVLGFRAPQTTELVPYGRAVIDGAAVSDALALEGVNGSFTLEDAALTRLKVDPPIVEDTTIKVVGYAPSSFLDGDGYLTDSRQSGTKPMTPMAAETMLWRPIRVGVPGSAPSSPIIGVASLIAPMNVGPMQASTRPLFRFWFKDLPITAKGGFAPPAADADFDAWQDGHLPLSGYEWRLIPQGLEDKDQIEVLRRGRDRIPFFGFALEPLQLQACALDISGPAPTGTVASVSILARLHLGPVSEAGSAGNLVVLTLGPDAQGELHVTGLKAVGEGLRFVLDAGKRRIEVSGHCSWDKDDGRPTMPAPLLTVLMFGTPVPLKGATANVAKQQDGTLSIEWSLLAGPMKKMAAGKGEVVIDAVTATTGVTLDGEGIPAAVSLRRTICLAPAGTEDGDTEVVPPIRIGLEDSLVKDLRLVGIGFVEPASKSSFKEGDETLTVTINGVEVGEQTLLPGLEGNGKGRLSIGMAARVGPFDGRAMPLTSGVLDGEVVYEGAGKASEGTTRVSLDRLMLSATCGRRSETASEAALPAGAGPPLSPPWTGGCAFYGRIAVENAIGWPQVASAGSTIPWDSEDKKQKQNGRTIVKLDPTTSWSHHVDYVLAGQSMTFCLAARIHARDARAAWAAPVFAHHVLTCGKDKPQAFTAVESIALGADEAIVPRVQEPDPKDATKSFADDPLAFAPRYRDRVVKGKPAAHGMLQAGVGRIATVLGGALGVSFRTSFWRQAKGTGLLLSGGFVGVIAEADGKPGHLIRLPILAAIGPGHPELARGWISQTGKAEVEVAWADSGAARSMAATFRGAVAPASTSDASLRAALLAGSRRPGTGPLTGEEAVLAVLVEQSFVVDCDPPDKIPTIALDKEPFFIAAAVSVSQAVKLLQAGTRPLVLSLVAGRALEGSLHFGLASAVVTHLSFPDGVGESPRPLSNPFLATLGHDLVIGPWNGPALDELGEALPMGLVAGTAYAKHVRPRAALLRTVGPDGRYRYGGLELPRPPVRARAARPVVNRAFADPGRGFLLGPGDKAKRWLPGADEGRTMPFRDGGDGASGLAGLSRQIALRAHAAAKTEPVEPGDPAPEITGLVWFAQTRAPIYLPLALKGVTGPPIPWLSPAMSRPRLPAVTLQHVLKDNQVPLQPLVPEHALLASVGDRPGISLARIARLETGLGAITAFDTLHPRFGRPAQGSAWSVRTERTPRPGPLPPNTGDPLRDRRPCASPLFATAPLDAIAGPADTVRGDASATLGAWSVTVVAAPGWAGMVTPIWDGTVRLYAEIAVASKGGKAPDKDAVETLFQLLLEIHDPGKAAKDDEPAIPAALRTRASLVIGSRVIPFERIHVVSKWKEVKWEAWSRPGSKAPSADAAMSAAAVVHGAVVGLVLDARPTDTSRVPGVALAAIAAALTADGGLPPVEIQLSVHPSSRRAFNLDDIKFPDYQNLAVDRAATAELAQGDDRAPVTLRLPLSPVIPSRGALPLAPTSILFTDPSYDAGLASVPVEDRKRVKPQGAPEDRGDVTVALMADRAQLNRRSSVTLMVDVAFEKKLEGFARVAAEAAEPGLDGDLVGPAEGTMALDVAVQQKDGARRDLFVARPSTSPVPGFKAESPRIALARVYELPLSTLVEPDGTAARLAAGDILELRVSEAKPGALKPTVWNAATLSGQKVVELDAGAIARVLRFVLTDEPVVQPPPALYATLCRRLVEPSGVCLSLPLHAQSPLPSRVDLRDAKADFRAGLMRRTAIFIWTLARPTVERAVTGLHVVKVDRNGQTFLPPASSTEDELKVLFVTARKVGD